MPCPRIHYMAVLFIHPAESVFSRGRNGEDKLFERSIIIHNAGPTRNFLTVGIKNQEVTVLLRHNSIAEFENLPCLRKNGCGDV